MTTNEKIDRFTNVAVLQQMAQKTGEISKRSIREELKLACSPLRNGAVAVRFQQRLYNKLAPEFLALGLEAPPAPTFPDPPVNQRVVPGIVIPTGQSLPIGHAALNQHVLFVGPTGCGKSTLEAIFIQDLLESSAIAVDYNCHKGEGCRLLNVFPDAAIVFRPHEEPINHAAPIEPIETFCWGWMAEFAKAFVLHPTTWPEAAEIYVQIQRGLNPGDLPPSLVDLRQVFRKLAENGRPKFFTVFQALNELCSILGRTAFIRRAPKLDGVARVIVHEHLGLPPKVISFLAALRFLRLQMEAVAEGRQANRLRRLHIEDEGQHAFSKELSQPGGSGYISPAKRAITQARSTGTGIVVSVQSLSSIDEILPANVGTIVIFRCPNPADAIRAAEILGLPAKAAAEIQNLPDHVPYVRSLGFSGPAKIRVRELDLGPYPSDVEVKRRLAGKLAALASQTEYGPEHSEQRSTLDYLHILGERAQVITLHPAANADQIRRRFLTEHQEFLREINANPTVAVTDHYQNLKWGAGRANRVKKQLLEMGLIRMERQSSRTGRPVEILTLTDLGKELLHDDIN